MHSRRQSIETDPVGAARARNRLANVIFALAILAAIAFVVMLVQFKSFR